MCMLMSAWSRKILCLLGVKTIVNGLSNACLKKSIDHQVWVVLNIIKHSNNPASSSAFEANWLDIATCLVFIELREDLV